MREESRERYRSPRGGPEEDALNASGYEEMHSLRACSYLIFIYRRGVPIIGSRIESYNASSEELAPTEASRLKVRGDLLPGKMDLDKLSASTEFAWGRGSGGSGVVMTSNANIYRPSMLAFVGFASHNVVCMGLGTRSGNDYPASTC